MNLSEIITLIISSGLFSYVVFYRSKKRTANAEANTSEHTAEGAALRNMHESLVEWKEIAEARETKLATKDVKLDEKDAVITKLYLEKGDDRKENHRLTSEVAQLQLQLQAVQFRECRKRGCIDRQPETGY